MTDGHGTAIATTDLGGGSGLFDQGIKLSDASGPLAAGISSGGAANPTGTNVAVVTYTLQVATSATPNETMTGTASLLGFTNAPGSDGHLATAADRRRERNDHSAVRGQGDDRNEPRQHARDSPSPSARPSITR